MSWVNLKILGEISQSCRHCKMWHFLHDRESLLCFKLKCQAGLLDFNAMPLSGAVSDSDFSSCLCFIEIGQSQKHSSFCCACKFAVPSQDQILDNPEKTPFLTNCLSVCLFVCSECGH